MGFEDLWKKYGNEVEKPRTYEQEPIQIKSKVEELSPSPIIKEIPHEQHKTPLSVKDEFGSISESSIGQRTRINTDDEFIPPKHYGKKWRLPNIDFDIGSLRYWPWVDIICITITVLGLLEIALNWELVTTVLFNAILSIVSGLVSFITVAVIFIIIIWLIFGRRRGPRW